MRPAKHTLLLLLLALLVVDQSFAQRPAKPQSGAIRQKELPPRLLRYVLKNGIPDLEEPFLIDGRAINQYQIEKHSAHLHALKSRERELQRTLDGINGQDTNPADREQITALVVRADGNNAVNRFLFTVAQESDGLSGNRVAALLIDSVGELVYAASNVSRSAAASNSIGRSSLAYQVIDFFSAAIEGLAKGTVDKQRAEQLARSLKDIGRDIYGRDNVREAIERRFEVEDSSGNACYDEANRLVLTKGADGKLRWLCLWETAV